jgi:cystathionine beta-synthase
MGTGGTLSGAGRFLKEKIKGLRIVGADPEGSIYTSIVRNGKAGETHVYKVEGIGHDYVPGTCDPSLMDDCITVSDRAAFQMARRLAREEGIFAGGSTGVNVVAALEVARGLPADAVVLTLVCDLGERYLSKQWNDDWMRDNQFLDEATRLTAAGVIGQRRREGEALVSVPADATVRDAIELMRKRDLSQLPVRRGDKIVGCISENQAIDLLFNRKDLATLRVEAVMGPPLPVMPGDTPAEEIASMLSRGTKAVLVDKGKGELTMLTKFDLIHASAR